MCTGAVKRYSFDDTRTGLQPLEHFRAVSNISGQSRTFPGSLEHFRAVSNISGQSRTFPGSLEQDMSETARGEVILHLATLNPTP